MEYKKIKEELVYEGKIISVYKDYIELSNGNKVVWDLVKHKGAAAIIPVREDGKIILVRQYRNALEEMTLEIPAGGLEPGEEPIECATRELEEETGFFSTEVEHLIDTISAVGFCNERVYIYYATGLQASKQNLDENEYVELEAYSMEELVRMIDDGAIQDGKTIAGILAYKVKFNQ